MSGGGQYKYDTTGQSYFFFLTVLLLFLLPYTYKVIRGGSEKAARRVPYPCVGWNVKTEQVKKVTTNRTGISKKHILLAVGWVLCAFVVQRASGIKAEIQAYDAYSILGISTGSTEKQIKKQFRRMSLKFHPDKFVLEANQTKEEVDNHFVELTKAYKSLTDEDYRHNVEMYGHPDGKQEYSQGIALPSWVVESDNIWYVIGAYALVLGVLLPYVVGRWWYGSRKLTKDGILNTTAASFFLGLKEETPFHTLLDILASADEFATDPALIKLRKAAGKAAIDEYARLASTSRDADSKLGWEGFSTWSVSKKRARVLIAAHMLRTPIKDATLLREKQRTIILALPLVTGLSSIALAYNWLSTFISILHLQQFILQAVHPSSSPLLQLPHVNQEVVKAAQRFGVETINQLGKLGAGDVEKLLTGFSEHDQREAFEVAKNWPVTQFVDAKFQVVGEKRVTPGAVVTFTLNLQIAPPGQAPKSVVKQATGADLTVEGGESSIEELIGRKKDGEDGEEPTPLAHAPHFPKDRKPTWYIFVGDHKLNRIFVPPTKFTDMGPGSTRTVKLSFQAPMGPGLYTFQAYVMCDSFAGTDVQRDMRMLVEAPADDVPAGAEDDISEPDEDSLAGQMAMMKGQPVRRMAESDDDDTSGTEEEEEDDSSDSDSD